MEVAPETFRRHLDWLADNSSVVALERAENTDSIVITFDDGYRSVYEEAFPF